MSRSILLAVQCHFYFNEPNRIVNNKNHLTMKAHISVLHHKEEKVQVGLLKSLETLPGKGIFVSIHSSHKGNDFMNLCVERRR